MGVPVWYWFCGFVLFTVEKGDEMEFFAFCRDHGIPVFGSRRKNGKIYAYVSYGDYLHRMRKAAKNSKVLLRCRKRFGVPFFLLRVKKRPGITVGLILMAAMMILLSQFIWDVRINAPYEIQAELRAQLTELGIYPGALRSGKELRKAEQIIARCGPELSWAGISLTGSRCTLSVRQRKDDPSIDLSVPVHIVAARDGVIASHSVTKGERMVSIGEAVRKGEVLISGNVSDPEGKINLQYHAQGTVQAYTEHVITVTEPFVQEQTLPVSAVRERISYELLGIEIPMYFQENGEFYEETEDIVSWFGCETGIVRHVKKYADHVTSSVTYSEEELAQRLRFSAYTKLLEELPTGCVLHREETVSSQAGQMTLTVTYHCLEEIGVEKEIVQY